MAEEAAAEEQQAESSGGKKSNSMLLILIIVLLIVIILVVVVGAILMMGGDDDNTNQMQQNAPQERSMQSSSQQNSGSSNMSLEEIGPMFPLDTFTVNLLSESGRRYLKVEMNLELSGEELGVELDNKTAVVRDIIIRLLSSKSLEEISTAKGKEKLKEQIVDQLNMRLRDGRVNNVYFTDFVVQ